MNPPESPSWRQRHRFAVHLTALLITVIAPFLLFFALEAGLGTLSALLFTLIAAAFALVLWVG